jgi:predicted Zn finger-like uncharacterized protein
MIVTCPACSTRFMVDARAIGETGRKVRCGRCSQVWLQKSAAEMPWLELAAATRAERKERAAAGAQPPDEMRRVQLPSVPPPPRNRRLIIGWAGLAAAVVLLILGATLSRQWMVAHWPATERLYAAFGADSTAPGSGLEFRRVEPSRTTEEGQPALVIQGEITNVSSGVRQVPKLKAILHDKAEHELQSVSFPPPQDQLAPGETLSFKTTITRPKDGASGIVVTFDTGT